MFHSYRNGCGFRLAPSLSEASTPLFLPPPSSLIELAWLLSLPATLLAVSAEHLVLGQPFILVWTLVLLLCLALHIGEILICRTLIKAWAPRHSKRN